MEKIVGFDLLNNAVSIPRGYKPGMLVPGLAFYRWEEPANLKEEG